MANWKSLQKQIFSIEKYFKLSNAYSVCRNYAEEYGDSIRWPIVKEIIDKFEETGRVADVPKPKRAPPVKLEQNHLMLYDVLAEQCMSVDWGHFENKRQLCSH